MNKFISFTTLLFAVALHAQSFSNGSTFGGTGITTTLDNFKGSNKLYSVGLYNSPFSFNGVTYSSFGGNADGYLVEYDDLGNEVNAWVFGGGADDAVISGTTDPSGNIYLMGYFQGAGSLSFDADPGNGQYLLANPSALMSRDLFIIKLDATGTFVWAKQVSNPAGATNEDGLAIKLDSMGNVFVVGRFTYAQFDTSGGGSALLQSTSGNFEGFILKLDSNGDYQWVNHLKNAENQVEDLYIDANDNITVVGKFKNSIQVDNNNPAQNLVSNGGFDAFILEYDNNGNFISSKSFGGPGNDSAEKIYPSPNGYAIGGIYNDVADLDPSSVVQTFPSLGNDIYVSQYNQAMNTWQIYNINSGGFNAINDLTVDNSGNVYVSGTFAAMTVFDPNSTNANVTPNGSTESFVLLINSNNTYNSHAVFTSSNRVNSAYIELFGNKVATTGHFKTDINLNPVGGSAIQTSSAIYECYMSMFKMATLGVEDIQNTSHNFDIYPNPASDFIRISNTEFTDFKIYTADGKLVSQGKLSDTQSINIQNLINGVYLLSLENKNTQASQTFIKK